MGLLQLERSLLLTRKVQQNVEFQQISNVGKDAEKKKIDATTVENKMEVSQMEIELPYDSSIPLLGIYPKNKNTNSKRYMHPPQCS